MNDILLDVKRLSIDFYTDEGTVHALDDISFTVKEGETIGIVGESGSGKSVTALSILRLIQDPPGKIVGGEIIFQGEDLLKKNNKDMRRIRGKDIAMVFQEPMTSLNPVFTIGNQLIEGIVLHQHLGRRQAKQKAIEVLRLVNMSAPEKRINQYPYELSGGMRQRVMIAMALSCNPKLLICDEPTTALDVTVQAEILELIKQLKQKMNTSVIMITHDLGVISEIADNVIVMYAGKMMEYSSVEDIFIEPLHPYTSALLRSIPIIGDYRKRLSVIEGMVPSLSRRPEGCLFNPRCEYTRDICKVERPAEIDFKGSRVRCWKYSDKW